MGTVHTYLPSPFRRHGDREPSRRVGLVSQASTDPAAHSQPRRWLSKCQFQIGLLLNAPTCIM